MNPTTTIQPRRLQLNDIPTANNDNVLFLNRYMRPAPHLNMALQNVSVSLQQQIDDKLSCYLPLCFDEIINNSSNNEWKKISLPASSTSSSKVLHHHAYQRLDTTHTTKSVMIQQTKAVLSHSPIQIFRLIIDITQRHKYESNIGTSNERMQYINPFTFLDYYSYKPVRACHGKVKSFASRRCFSSQTRRFPSPSHSKCKPRYGQRRPENLPL